MEEKKKGLLKRSDKKSQDKPENLSKEDNPKVSKKAAIYMPDRAYNMDELFVHFEKESKNGELKSQSHKDFLKSELKRLDHSNYMNGEANFAKFQEAFNNLYNRRSG